jgi:DNA helicase-2/ATP-dependent DNA helicase PcrA
MDYSGFVNGTKKMLIAPAGYGKTYTIVECLKHTTGKQLILTHTHAGVAAIKEKIKTADIESKKYHIETICGFAQKYVHAFYTNDDMPSQESQEYFPFVIEKACDLFCIIQVKKVLEATYSGLFVDEYQDCSKKQHEMIMALSSVLPTRILGDPMQGIFNFNGDIIDLNSDIEDFEISSLETPHRWYNNGSNALGDALKNIRDSLNNGEEVNLSNYGAIPGLEIHRVAARDIWVPRSNYRVKINQHLNDSESILLLVPNAYSKSNINSRKRLKAQIDYTKSLALIEAIDQEDLYIISTNADGILHAPQSITQIKDYILLKLFNKGDIDQWFNSTGLKNKRTPDEKEKSDKLKKMFDDFISNPIPSTMLSILKTLKDDFKFKYGREELIQGVIKALETAAHDNISVYEGMKQHRNIVRRVGRKVTGKCLGTTLLTKGLEFDTVIVLDAHEFDCPKHLYVALTRCCKKLIIFTENLILSP